MVSFSRDHHFGLLLVWKIRQGLSKAVDPERIGNYVIFFYKEDLEKHFAEEEELLFSKLPAEDVLRRQAEKEHEAIYKLIAALEKKRGDEQLLSKLADELEEHIRFEERKLFNHLQDNISSRDLEVIATRFSDVDKNIDGKWDDKFWILR